MLIYTSYYSKRIPAGAILVSISRSEPKGYKVHVKWAEVAPAKDLLDGYKKGLVNDAQYTAEYLDQLRKLYKAGRLAAFVSWASKQDKPVVLLCWEAPGKFCHRHILADALNKAFNAEIKEY